MPIRCTSSIVKVTVHGRGALVTRRLGVPDDLPDGEVELVAEGISGMAEAGSVRAALPGATTGRTVVAVRTALHVPNNEPLTGPGTERLREAAARMERLRGEIAALGALRDKLAGTKVAPVLRSATVEKRTRDALATGAMLSALEHDLDARLVALEGSLVEATHAHEAAQLAWHESRSSERIGAGHPTRTITVLVTGTGALAEVEVTYAIAAARWWPVYTLRITDHGKRARWWIEALVAQRSGEDWSAVRLALSTADLAFDARLPELSSLRLGKAQPAPGKGYREPAPGLDRMFAGYERAFAEPSPIGAPQSMPAPTSKSARVDLLQEDGEEHDDGSDAQAFLREEVPAQEMAMGRARMPVAMGAPTAHTPARAAAPMPPMAAMTPMKSFGGSAPGGGGTAPPPPSPEPDDAPLEPCDAWLDFDALALNGPRGPRRGRLAVADNAVGGNARRDPLAAIEAAPAPPGARDPVSSRGMFDHRYDAEGTADVPSDGHSHRVSLGAAETAPILRWRTVPRESAAVYREAELRNPFDAPLLAGPVDVYLDGALLAVASVDRIDRGGTMHVGMGVEERIRAARNVRTSTEATGILGGTTAVLHTVSIELSSTIGTSTLVDVIDRIPVSDDKTVEVTAVSSRPEPEPYTQTDRGAPVRGALMWRQIVPAGARATIEHQYRITLPSKSEIVGGNRRE